MAKIPIKIVVPSDRSGPLINRQFFKQSEMVTDDASTLQPLPITQAEYDASKP